MTPTDEPARTRGGRAPEHFIALTSSGHSLRTTSAVVGGSVAAKQPSHRQMARLPVIRSRSIYVGILRGSPGQGRRCRITHSVLPTTKSTPETTS